MIVLLLPGASICLFSPQTYHKLYGWHNDVFGDKAVTMIDRMSIPIALNCKEGNIPTIYNSTCNATYFAAICPLIQSALPHYERKVDFMGSWSSNDFANLGIKYLAQVVSSESDFEYSFSPDHERWGIHKRATNPESAFQNFNLEKCLGLRSVAMDENKNLSHAHKELLLWQLKLGIDMQHVQKLIRVSEMGEPTGAFTTIDRVIKPQLNSVVNCPVS